MWRRHRTTTLFPKRFKSRQKRVFDDDVFLLREEDARSASPSRPPRVFFSTGFRESRGKDDEEESIDAIARRGGQFDFFRVAERMFEDQREEEEDDRRQEQQQQQQQQQRRRHDKEDYTKRWEYHAWHLACALVPLGLSAAVVSYVRRYPHKNLVARAEKEKEEGREAVEEALRERNALEEDVMRRAKKEDERRYGRLLERLEKLENAILEGKTKKDFEKTGAKRSTESNNNSSGSGGSGGSSSSNSSSKSSGTP